jgi:hypothetical protein
MSFELAFRIWPIRFISRMRPFPSIAGANDSPFKAASRMTAVRSGVVQSSCKNPSAKPISPDVSTRLSIRQRRNTMTASGPGSDPPASTTAPDGNMTFRRP